jgi:Osmosensitive K+ channel histidine kinase
MKKNKNHNTHTLLKNRFITVVVATIALSLLPFLLMFLTIITYQKKSFEKISAAERIMPLSSDVDVSDYISSGGSAMIVDNELHVTLLGGKPIWKKASFSETEWADFLHDIDDVSGYEYDIAYKSGSDGYWLVIRKPVSIKISLGLFFNNEAPHFSRDIIEFSLIISIYFIALAVFITWYSKRTAMEINAREKIQRDEEEKRMLLVSEISHDLKTPLASVQGYSEMLLSKDIENEKKQEYLQKIYDNSVRSNNILRSLFMYSKLESTDFILNEKRTDICEYTRQIIAEYIPAFEENGFKYTLSIPDKEIFVNIDTELFRRVFDNLFENAVKYNTCGTEITLTIAKKESGGKPCVNITIADNGIGIAEEDIDKIFQPFFRADKTSANQDGSGLGLAIVQKIITLHNGKITYAGNDSGCGWLICIPSDT